MSRVLEHLPRKLGINWPGGAIPGAAGPGQQREAELDSSHGRKPLETRWPCVYPPSQTAWEWDG